MQSAISKNSMTLEQAVGQQFLLTFEGRESPTDQFLEILRRRQVGGVVLFRHKNMSTLAELRGLTHAQRALPPNQASLRWLIAADQEGGQLMAVDQTTQFPGNMALGAAGSDKLAYKVGRAIGEELSAVGINVDFAPVCDVNSNPRNPVIGTRARSGEVSKVGGTHERRADSRSAKCRSGCDSQTFSGTWGHFQRLCIAEPRS